MDTLKFRGVINGKAGKAAALPKFSDMIYVNPISTRGGGGQIMPNHCFACLKKSLKFTID